MPHVTQTIQASGPILECRVGVSVDRAKALKSTSSPIPPTVLIQGLVDTGASASTIDPTVVEALGLTPTGQAMMITPTTGAVPQPCATFDISLTLVHPNLQLRLGALPVCESVLAHQGFEMLIGRDVLKQCLLVYDGQDDTFTLAF